MAVRVKADDPAETVPADPDKAFRTLAREQLPRLVSIARRLVGDDAEDMVQECLVKAFQGFTQLRDLGAGPGWLASILVNCCRDLVRTSARHPAEIDYDDLEHFSLFKHIAYEDPYPYSDSLHLDFLDEFTAEDVRAVVMRLPLTYRSPKILSADGTRLMMAYGPGIWSQPVDDGSSIQSAVAENVSRLADVIRPTPYFVNGQQQGYRVYPGRDREHLGHAGPAEALGLPVGGEGDEGALTRPRPDDASRLEVRVRALVEPAPPLHVLSAEVPEVRDRPAE